jgi:peptide/nickel transport system substrate-binding protein
MYASFQLVTVPLGVRRREIRHVDRGGRMGDIIFKAGHARHLSLALWRGALVLIATVVVAVAWPAVGNAATSPSPSAEGAVFRVGWLLEPENLNPYIGLLGQDYEIYALNYDYLIGYDPETFSPRPEIATSWSVSSDQKRWTFKIRQGVKWQDGEPLTASDVAFSYNYIIDNEIATYTTYTDGIIKAVATAPDTVEIICRRPKANLLAPNVPIVPEHIWSKISGKAATTSYANRPPIVGSGPFQVVEWKRGSYIKLAANKNYWGGAPKIDTLFFQTYTNADTMMADLKGGELDAATELPLAQVQQMRAVSGLNLLKGPHWRFNELAFNCYDSPNSLGNPVLLDQRFRHALNWAVDRDKIVSIAFFGQADSGSTLLPPCSKYHWQVPSADLYTYDPAKAKAELAAAGYQDANGDGYVETKAGKSLKLRLYVTTDSIENQTAAKLIVSELKAVGVRTTLSVVDSGALLDAQYNYVNGGKTYAPDYDLFIWYWTQDADPSIQLSVLTKDQIEGWSDTCWWSPEYDRLYTKQDSETDISARIKVAQQMQKIAYQATPYVVFAYPYQIEAYRSDRWDGVVASPSNVEGYDGSAFYNYFNVDTYRFVHVNTAETSDGAGSSAWIVVVVVVAVAVLAGAVLIAARRRSRSMEE